MNGVHRNVSKRDFEKMYPGRLGRMTNLYELNAGALDDRQHRAGVSIMSPSGDPREPDFDNRKSYVTPMKTFIAQEMSTMEDPKRDPNLVAKLMGIDVLPQHEPGSTTQRSHSRIHARSYLDIPTNKNVHEIWQKSPKSRHKGRYVEETMNGRKMNIIRQKFVEAKHLSMDEKLRQSKQFRDAIDVLISNKDLFLKCLHEPNSKDLYSLNPPPESNRITVLRPSKVTNGSNDSAGARYRDEQQIKRGAFLGPNKSEKTHLGTSPAADLECDGNSTQPTRIVVLKPNPRKPQNNGKAISSLKSVLPTILLGEDVFGDEEDDECLEAREVAKEITLQMYEKLGMHRRDETFISSVFSNGYVGDSSFNKSETEVMSPVSSHSWDYSDRIGSPFSSSMYTRDRISSPFSSSMYTRASHSPESSVCREAKKRLSERWETMASSDRYQEQTLLQRSSSTLGDVLAHSEIKKEAYTSDEPEDSDTHLDSEHRRREGKNVDRSARNLVRSKFVPVSNIEFDTELNVGISVLDKRKPRFSKDIKEKSVKSSFRGKVSRFFFSRNKESSINESFASGIDETRSIHGEFRNEKGLNYASPGLLEPNRIDKQDMVFPESGSAVAELIVSGDARGNHDQPSLVSVFNTPLEENEHTTQVLSHYINPRDQHGIERPLNSIGSNLIDKSPPIGSIARTLTRDNSCVDNSASHPLSETLTTPKTDEEQECFFFVKTLLSESGLHGEAQPNSFLSRWHSPESPLDPSLRDSYIDVLNDKQWQKKSSQQLMFDCVNEVLIDIAVCELESGPRAIRPCNSVLDEVWARMKVLCLCSQGECVSLGEINLKVDTLVRNEVMGKVWNDHFRSEMDDWRTEIGGKLLEELLQETIVELTGRKADCNAFSF